MTRFIAGVVATLLVQALGWPRIERALDTARASTVRAYNAATEETSK